MATIVRAYILVGTDIPEVADEAVTTLLNGAIFESDSPVLDFKIGIEQMVQLSSDYEDGEFVHHIPGADQMIATSQFARPC